MSLTSKGKKKKGGSSSHDPIVDHMYHAPVVNMVSSPNKRFNRDWRVGKVAQK